MLIMLTSKPCQRCGVKGEADYNRHYLTRIGKVVCRHCARLYEPPRMSLGQFSNSPLIWNYQANKHEDITSVDRLTYCGWFIRSEQETIIKLKPRKITLFTLHLEFHKTESGVRCLRCPDYPYYEEGIQECGVEECRNFRIDLEPPRLKFPKQRSRFKL